MNKKVKIFLIIALFSFSGIYLFFTIISPMLFSNHAKTTVVKSVVENNVKKVVTSKTQNLKEKELKNILPANITNPFLSLKYLTSFAFINKTSLSIETPPQDAIMLNDLYFVGTFYNQDKKTLQVIINKNGKDAYISKGDVISEAYGKLKLMKIYLNFLLFMDKNGKKYYIQK